MLEATGALDDVDMDNFSGLLLYSVVDSDDESEGEGHNRVLFLAAMWQLTEAVGAARPGQGKWRPAAKSGSTGLKEGCCPLPPSLVTKPQDFSVPADGEESAVSGGSSRRRAKAWSMPTDKRGRLGLHVATSDGGSH